MITRRTPFPGPNRGAPQGTVGYCRSSVQFQFKKAKAVANLAHEISLGEDFMRDVTQGDFLHPCRWSIRWASLSTAQSPHRECSRSDDLAARKA